MRRIVGCQFIDWHRKWAHAVGSFRPRKGRLRRGGGTSCLYKWPLPIATNYLNEFQVYQLISRRRFQQMEVLEGQNILVTISGKKNRVRVYYLSWLKSKILRTDGLSDVSIASHLLDNRFIKSSIFIIQKKTLSFLAASWTTKRMDKCWWSPRRRTLQNCEIRTHQIFSDSIKGLNWNLCMGTKTIS